MTQFVLSQDSAQELQFPIMLRVMTDEETKEYHLKKLYELSLKAVGQIAHLDEPNEEPKEWIKKRMRGLASTWEVWDA